MTDDRIVDGLVERIAAVQGAAAQRDRAGRHARMRSAVLDHVAWDEPRSRSIGRHVVTAAAAAIAAVVLLWVVRPAETIVDAAPDVTARPQAQVFVVESEETPRTISLSGGNVRVEASTRARLVDRHREGAEVELERGTLELRREGAPETPWQLRAGPYDMRLLGTMAAVTWTPETTGLRLVSQQGRTEVRGPGIEGTRVLEEGERLVLATAEPPPTDDVPARPSDDGIEVADDSTPPSTEDAAVAITPDRPSTPSRPTSRSWTELAADGAYAEALAAAERRGFDRLCRTLDAAGLLELADVARYAGKSGRARKALLALRRRFAGTEAAATAAFDLGRLAPRGECEAGATWFRTYLRERPQGTMADAARRRVDECETDPSR